MDAAATEPMAFAIVTRKFVDVKVERVVSCTGNLDGFAPLLLERLEGWVCGVESGGRGFDVVGGSGGG